MIYIPQTHTYKKILSQDLKSYHELTYKERKNILNIALRSTLITTLLPNGTHLFIAIKFGYKDKILKNFLNLYTTMTDIIKKLSNIDQDVEDFLLKEEQQIHPENHFTIRILDKNME